MTDRTCPGYGCDAQLTDEYLCRRCQHRAERALADLPALTRDLAVTITRQDRVTRPAKRGDGAEQPLPVNLTAEHRGRVVLELLFEWADYVAQWQGVKGLPLFARDIPLTELVPNAVAVLLRHSDWMRHQEQGPGLADAIHQVRRDLRRLVDQPPARLYAGPCGGDLGYDGYACRLPLYRKWGSEDITCDGHRPQPVIGAWSPTGCGAVHTAADRDEFLAASVAEHLLPLRLLWDALYLLVPGCGLDWRAVQRWTREHRTRTVVGTYSTGRQRIKVTVTPPRLMPAGVDSHGEPLYRGSDVLQLARDDSPRRGRRRTRGAGRMSA